MIGCKLLASKGKVLHLLQPAKRPSARLCCVSPYLPRTFGLKAHRQSGDEQVRTVAAQGQRRSCGRISGEIIVRKEGLPAAKGECELRARASGCSPFGRWLRKLRKAENALGAKSTVDVKADVLLHRPGDKSGSGIALVKARGEKTRRSEAGHRIVNGQHALLIGKA